MNKDNLLKEIKPIDKHELLTPISKTNVGVQVWRELTSLALRLLGKLSFAEHPR
jgi:hypothetical protein